MAVCWEQPMTAVPFPDTHFHSVATLRDEHATTFHSSPPCDTRRESATILHSRLRVSYCLLFFISSPPVDLSLDLAVSGFVCVCLSVCSSVLLAFHPKGGCYCRGCIGYQGNERKSSTLPPHFQQTFMTILGIYTEKHSTLHMLDYSGMEKHASRVNPYWQWCILRKHSGPQGLRSYLRPMLPLWSWVSV